MATAARSPRSKMDKKDFLAQVLLQRNRNAGFDIRQQDILMRLANRRVVAGAQRRSLFGILRGGRRDWQGK